MTQQLESTAAEPISAAATAKSPRVPRAVEHGLPYMLLLALMGTGWGSIDQLLGTIIPITLKHFTQSAFLIACIIDVHRLFGFLIQPYVAWKGDHLQTRFGRRRSFLVFAYPGSLVFVVLFGSMPMLIPPQHWGSGWAFALVLVSYLLMQFFQETCMGCDAPLYAETFPQQKLGRAFSLRQVTNGLMMLVILYFAMHWADENEIYPYLTSAGFLAISILIVLFAVRETPRPATAAAPKQRYNPLKHAAMLRTPIYLKIAVLGSIALMLPASFLLFHSLYGTETLHLSKGDFGRATAPTALAGLVLAIPVGFMVDRLGPKRALAIAFCLAMLASTGMAFWAHDFISLLICSVAFAAANCAALVSMSPLVFQNAAEGEQGKVFGLIQFVRAAAACSTSPIIGLLVEVLNKDYRVGYWACIGLASIGLLVLLSLPGKPAAADK